MRVSTNYGASRIPTRHNSTDASFPVTNKQPLLLQRPTFKLPNAIQTSLTPTNSAFTPFIPKSPVTSSKLSELKFSNTSIGFFPSTQKNKGNSENKHNRFNTITFEEKPQTLNKIFYPMKESLVSDSTKIDNLFQQDYSNFGQKKKSEINEAEDVKKLDEWNLMIKRNKAGYAIKPNELMEQHRRGQAKETRQDMPTVRKDIINRIVRSTVEDEEEGPGEKGKKPFAITELIAQAANHYEDTRGNDEHRSLDVMQRENNRDILNELITKKIKEFVKSLDSKYITEAQMRVHIKKIADKVIAQFNTLKGPLGTRVIHDCLEHTIKALDNCRIEPESPYLDLEKALLLQNALGTSDNNEMKREEVIINYELMEDLLTDKLNLCIQDEENTKARLKQLSSDSFNTKDQLLILQRQLEEAEKIMAKEQELEAKRKLEQEQLTKDRSPFRIANMTYSGKGSKRFGLEADQLVKEFNLFEKMSLAKKNSNSTPQPAELSKMVKETSRRLEKINEEIRSLELTLENSKNMKEECKIQIRDLYYKCLKDDLALLKGGRNQMSYVWVIRSLWKINEEVKESHFPGFLDSASIRFLVEYARLQDDLEKYCREHNLMNLITNFEDFKYLAKTQKVEAIVNTETNSPTNYPRIHTQGSPHGNSRQSLFSHIDRVQGLMADLKRVNLKAKRQVPIGRVPFKAKNVTYKWEDVDPVEMNKILLLGEIETDPEPVDDEENLKIVERFKTESELNKVHWEQGLEKLRVISSLRKKEMDRLFSHYMIKELDEYLKNNLQKAFKMLFGQLAHESFNRFLREKMRYDQNTQGRNKKGHLNNSQAAALIRAETKSLPQSPRLELPLTKGFLQDSQNVTTRNHTASTIGFQIMTKGESTPSGDRRYSYSKHTLKNILIRNSTKKNTKMDEN